MNSFIVVVALMATAQAVSFFDLVHEEFQTFKLQHKKNYENDIVENFRMKIFMENKYKIAQHNTKYELGLVSYKLNLNKYADMLHHEFIGTLNGFNKTKKGGLKAIRKSTGATYIEPVHVELPNTVDWREKGAVTPVKDQGHCGSCWAFSATGSLEGQHFRKTGVLVSLSEQNLVDCSGKYGNNGCEGGLMDQAFQYIKANRGLDTEKSYPYDGQDEKCKFNPRNIGADDVGFVDIPQGDERKLKAAVATVGPVSIAIDASHQSFQFYSEGVYDEVECSSEELDHGVLIVGYGTDEEGRDYWLVKNSWGPSWGLDGYIKMSRNKGNQCGVASSASYPLV
ncbi:cathepsin L [Fopius arisanus]|uniref:Cathepsin L n=2 Tax=Fopius arisanus TaxID=64838 RepID=A0A9R1SVB7_9HYME|nr:PREDICTED: cathepsin L [Fopius arisanus]